MHKLTPGFSNVMKRVIVSMNVTLDGYMSGPRGELDWHFPYWNTEMCDHGCAQLRTMDTIILGRKTYEPMAEYWPGAPPDDFSGMMNSYRKYVFSTTLQNPAWINTSVMRGNVIKAVTGLKQEGGKNIIIYGSSSIISALMPSQLVDEFRLWVHPVVTGEGRPLFKALTGALGMKLTRTKSFGSGVILLYYQPAYNTDNYSAATGEQKSNEADFTAQDAVDQSRAF